MSPPTRGRPRRALIAAAAAIPALMLAALAAPNVGRTTDALVLNPEDGQTLFRVLPGAQAIRHPRDVHVAPDGTLLVVDRTATVHRLSAEGVLLASTPMPEQGRGNPQGVSSTTDGRILVADTHYNRVVALSRSGSFLFSFGSFGEGDGQFIYPTSVAECDDGRIFVAEYGGNDRVQVFDPEGGHLFSFGGPGDAPGLFSRPAGICFCRDGLLYVADSCNHRIQAFRRDGSLVRAFGSLGSGPGEFQYPFDVSPYPGGAIAVVEYGNNRVQVLGCDGKPVFCAGGPGSFTGGFFNPWGIATQGSDIFVADTWNHRLVLVRPARAAAPVPQLPLR